MKWYLKSIGWTILLFLFAILLAVIIPKIL